MIDMGSISAAVTSLKAAGDVAKGLIGLHTMAEVQSKAIELNQMIIDAQHQIFAPNAAQTALVERVRELEKEIASMEAWDGQKDRYQMCIPFSGTTVYALKKSMSNGEPPHYICANCYESRKRSILQNSKDKEGWTLFLCPGCRAEIRTRWRGGVPAAYAEDVKPQ